jgi:hypothetical protein
MKNKSYYSKRFALTVIACIVSSSNFAASSKAPLVNEYPTYVSAKGISASAQIPMQALWLHMNSSRVGGVTLPRSFDMSGYWPYMVANNTEYQNYLKTNDTGKCVANPGNNATIERAMQQQGLDIYDGAVWQVALAVAVKNNPVLYTQDIEDYKNFLMTGVNGGFSSYMAFNGYTYNGVSMPSAKNAYLLKFVSPSWALNYDSINDCNLQWPEWSAVTGEEAWAVFIGPVQSIYQLNDGDNNPNWSSVSQAGDYIQIGKNALGAIKQMQAPTGGVYRNVALPGQPQNFDISVENNFSLYAGLTIFEQALKARVATNSAKLKVFKLANAKTQVHTTQMSQLQQTLSSDQDDINTVNTIKNSMVKFFAGQGGVNVFDRTGNYFYAGINGTTAGTDFAVDVQTWGATVIASSKKDPNDPNDPDLLKAVTDAYGPDVMYNMLQAAITKSAYLDSNNNLLGVGYTSQKPTDSFYELSGEWTFGAINAAIVLADHYKNDTSKYATLISQAQKMLDGVTAETSSLLGSPTGSTSRIGYLYANKRAFIPFGWYSNKAYSTASTGWGLLVNACFNPLELGGGKYQAVCQQLKLGK